MTPRLGDVKPPGCCGGGGGARPDGGGSSGATGCEGLCQEPEVAGDWSGGVWVGGPSGPPPAPTPPVDEDAAADDADAGLNDGADGPEEPCPGCGGSGGSVREADVGVGVGDALLPCGPPAMFGCAIRKAKCFRRMRSMPSLVKGLASTSFMPRILID